MPWYRIGARELPAPARAVTVLVVRERAARYRVVAQGEHRPRNGIEQRGGCLVVGPIAACDVAGADQRHRRRGRRGALRYRPERGWGAMVVFDAGDRDANNDSGSSEPQ